MSVNVIELERTCSAVPAIWEGRTDDGLAVFIRYRHGYLRVGVGANMEEAVFPGREGTSDQARMVFEWDSDDSMDGFMSDHQLRDKLIGVVDFAPGLIEDPCTSDHADLALFGCDVCGQEPTQEQADQALIRMQEFLGKIVRHNKDVAARRAEAGEADPAAESES